VQKIVFGRVHLRQLCILKYNANSRCGREQKLAIKVDGIFLHSVFPFRCNFSSLLNLSVAKFMTCPCLCSLSLTLSLSLSLALSIMYTHTARVSFPGCTVPVLPEIPRKLAFPLPGKKSRESREFC
jgi:hypothetical protein